DRSSGPPGSGSLIVLSASAGSGASASVAAPAVPRNSRRDAIRCACRARSVVSIIAYQARDHDIRLSGLSKQELTLSEMGGSPICAAKFQAAHDRSGSLATEI